MKPWALAALIPLLGASCSSGDNGRPPAPAPVPRPRAYPRLRTYPPAYHVERVQGVAIAVNDSALLSEPRPGWFDLHYPLYDLTVHCTLSTGEVGAVLANRGERMARNVGGAYAEITQWPGATLIVAPGALLTPVQFVATDSARLVLSGTAVANWPEGTSPDSVGPLIRAVEADMTHLLRELW